MFYQDALGSREISGPVSEHTPSVETVDLAGEIIVGLIDRPEVEIIDEQEVDRKIGHMALEFANN